MAEKRRTIRYELPAEDAQLLQSPEVAGVPAWGTDATEMPGGAADQGYQAEHVYELMGSSVEVGGTSWSLSLSRAGKREREWLTGRCTDRRRACEY